MDKKDMVIVGLVVLLVLVVAFSFGNIETTGKVTDYPCQNVGDDGNDIYVKGGITGSDNTGAYTKTEFCSADNTKVIEYRCNVGQGAPGWERLEIDCGISNPGSTCVDGACTR
ncbi:MAG: hypothetical protein KJ623_01110 [Nanoarchaeota archaeon]|nr:hypothetical protein [Nanoarchaeota archaeon]